MTPLPRRVGPPTEEEVAQGEEILNTGTKSGLRALRQPVLASLCSRHIPGKGLEECMKMGKKDLFAHLCNMVCYTRSFI